MEKSGDIGGDDVTQPLAKIIDAVAGKDFQHCTECQRRKEKLNRIGAKIGL